MVKRIGQDGKQYEMHKHYEKDEKKRKEYNRLAAETFGLSFESWYQAGCWGEGYCPYSLFDGARIVSSISASVLDFLYEGNRKRFIQLGAVMTDPAYRNRGLSRILLEEVLKDCGGNEIYLYANSSVLGFYPKFGFQRKEEYAHYRQLCGGAEQAVPLDLSVERDALLFYSVLPLGNRFSALSLLDNPGLFLFYCLDSMRENLYYLPDCGAVVAAEYRTDGLALMEVFGGSDRCTLDDIMRSAARKAERRVLLGFTPLDESGFLCERMAGEDGFFIRSGNETLFDRRCLRFPALSHT